MKKLNLLFLVVFFSCANNYSKDLIRNKFISYQMIEGTSVDGGNGFFFYQDHDTVYFIDKPFGYKEVTKYDTILPVARNGYWISYQSDGYHYIYPYNGKNIDILRYPSSILDTCIAKNAEEFAISNLVKSWNNGVDTIIKVGKNNHKCKKFTDIVNMSRGSAYYENYIDVKLHIPIIQKRVYINLLSKNNVEYTDTTYRCFIVDSIIDDKNVKFPMFQKWR